MPVLDGNKLNQRHLAILDMFLQEKKQVDIAQALGMSDANVSIIVNSPTFQHELALRRASIIEKHDTMLAQKQLEDDPVLEKLKAGALQAANRLVLNLADNNGNVANKAAEAILNRVGVCEKRSIDITERSLQIVISASDASLLAETLKMVNQKDN